MDFAKLTTAGQEPVSEPATEYLFRNLGRGDATPSATIQKPPPPRDRSAWPNTVGEENLLGKVAIIP